MVHLNVTITGQQKELLDRTKKESGLAISDQIRRALDDWFEKRQASAGTAQ